MAFRGREILPGIALKSKPHGHDYNLMTFTNWPITMPHARHCAKFFTCVISLNPHNSHKTGTTGIPILNKKYEVDLLAQCYSWSVEGLRCKSRLIWVIVKLPHCHPC